MQLTDAGFDALRFDYRGTGNSSGECEFCNAESLGTDNRSAVNYFRDESSIKQLSLLGIRLGATIAATANVQDVEALILWDPVVEGEPFVGYLDRFHNHAITSHARFTTRLSHTGRLQILGCLSDGVKEPETLRDPMLPSFSFPVGYLGQVLS